VTYIRPGGGNFARNEEVGTKLAGGLSTRGDGGGVKRGLVRGGNAEAAMDGKAGGGKGGREGGSPSPRINTTNEINKHQRGRKEDKLKGKRERPAQEHRGCPSRGGTENTDSISIKGAWKNRWLEWREKSLVLFPESSRRPRDASNRIKETNRNLTHTTRRLGTEDLGGEHNQKCPPWGVLRKLHSGGGGGKTQCHQKLLYFLKKKSSLDRRALHSIN